LVTRTSPDTVLIVALPPAGMLTVYSTEPE
jgi:hypothetical protein